MEKDYYINLLRKLKQGTIAAHEKVILESWIKSDHSVEFRDSIDRNIISFQDSIKGAGNKESTNSFQKYKIWMSVAASVLLFSMIGLFLNRESDNIIEVYATDKTQEIILPDNSIISLEKDSRIIYNKDFGKNNRDISLAGSAHFSVQKNEEVAFVIKTKNAITRVIGTAFYLEENDVDGMLRLEVEEGIVSINVEGTSPKLKRAGEYFFYDLKERAEKELELNPNRNFWRTHTLVFDNEPLMQVLDEIENYYNVTIETTGNASTCIFSSTLKDLSVDEIIEIISMTYQGYWEIKEPAFYTLSNLNCN